MTNMTTIAGITVDAGDPCALKPVLEIVRLKMISGELVEEMSIQSPVTRDAVRFSPTKLAMLDAEIDRLGRACMIKQGKRPPSRRRILRY